MKRPDPPQEYLDYERIIKNGPPRCCHTCIEYTDAGHCEKFDMRPPDEFTRQVGVCEDWLGDIPF